MQDQHNQPDTAIDKTLAALNAAMPPEGMEGRIAARIVAQPSPALSRWRDLFTGYSLAGAWWRGALTGAAAAILAGCAVLLLHHHSQMAPPQMMQNNAAAPHTATPVPATPAAQVKADTTRPAANPCPPAPGPMLRHANSTAKPMLLRVAAPVHHPLLTEPLTAQERALLQLARTADPQQLAILNPETQAKLNAEDAAEFDKFFAPPPRPTLGSENEGTRTTTQEGDKL